MFKKIGSLVIICSYALLTACGGAGGGGGGVTADSSFQKPVPEDITFNQDKTIGDDSFEFEWNEPTTESSYVKEYLIREYKNADCQGASFREKYQSARKFRANDLDDNQLYSFSVTVAYNNRSEFGDAVCTSALKVDHTPPVINIEHKSAHNFNGPELQVSGTCNDEASSIKENKIYYCLGNLDHCNEKENFTNYVSCNEGNFEIALDTSGWDQTSYELKLYAMDIADNEMSFTSVYSDSSPLFIDFTAPNLELTSPLEMANFIENVTLEGVCESGRDILINGTGLEQDYVFNCNNSSFSQVVALSSLDGPKLLNVSQTDLAGNSSSISRTLVKDSLPPNPVINSPVVGTYFQENVILSGECETGISVEIAGLGVAAPLSVNCVNNAFSASLNLSSGEGGKEILLSQTDSAGNSGTATLSLMRDNTSPVVAFTSPEANSSHQDDVVLSGSCETGLVVNFSGAGHASPASTSCSGGSFSETVAFSSGEGVKVIEITQTDAAGNSGSASLSVERDNTAPLLQITSPEANSSHQDDVILSGSCEAGLVVNFSGTGHASPASTSCSGGSFSETVVFSSGEGAKVIEVTQTDAAGNSGSASLSLERDNTAPVLAFTSPVANSSHQDNVVLSGSCEAGLVVNFSGAGHASPASASCSGGSFSETVVFSSGEGAKVIEVTQTDAAGNSGSASLSLERDNTAPVLAFTSPAVNSSHQDNVVLSGSCEAGLVVDFSGAGHASPASASCSGGSFSETVVFSSGEGAKVIELTQTDAAGNSGSTNISLERDNTSPVLAFTSPVANSSHQDNVVLSGSCEAGLVVDFSGAGHASPASTSCSSGGSFSETVVFSSGEGSKVIEITQTDAAGNSGSANLSVERDNTSPVLAFTSPSGNSSHQDDVILSGSCEAGLVVNFSGAGHASPASASCSGGSFSETVVFSSGEGTKVIEITQTDAAGNLGSTNISLERDNTAPVLAFTSPAVNSSHQDDVVLSGSCEAGLVVNFSGAGHASPASTSCSSGGSFSETVVFSSGEGSKVIEITQTDAAGNAGSASLSLERDNTAPVLQITAPLANSEFKNEINLSGNCESSLPILISGSGHSSPSSTSCTEGVFSEVVILSATDGSKEITVSQTDGANNSTITSLTVVKDNVAPNLTIASPAENSTHINGLTLTGACEDGYSINLSGAGLASPSTVTCSSSSYSVEILYTIGDGSKIIELSQQDEAGNLQQVTRSFIKDATAPLLTIASPSEGFNAQSSITMTGACETGLDVSFSGAGILSAFDMDCIGGSYSKVIFFSESDGNKSITVSQSDIATNTTTVTRNFVRDEQIPVITQDVNSSPAYTNTDAVGFGGDCETGKDVDVYKDDVFQGSTLCSSGRWLFSVSVFDPEEERTVASTADDGTRTIRFEQIDAAGNKGSTTVQWIRDTQGPPLTITSHQNLTTATNTVTFSGNCESGNGLIDVSGEDTKSFLCNGTTWSYEVSERTSDATYAYTFTLTDSAGNPTVVNAQWTRDTTGPAFVINEVVTLVSHDDTAVFSGSCTDGLSIIVSGADNTTTTCASGQWSYTTAVKTTDGLREYQFKQQFNVNSYTAVSGEWVRDTVAPVLNSGYFDLNEGASSTDRTFVSVDLNATDDLSNISHFCLRAADSTKPMVGDSCWISVSAPSPGLIANKTLNLEDFIYVLGVDPGQYNLFAWVKDEAENISSISSSGAGTLGKDLAQITYIDDKSPLVDYVIATTSDSPSNPASQLELTAPAGTDLYIKWRFTDDNLLPSNPVSLYFTTDEVNYTLIQENLANIQGAGCVADHGSSTLDDGATGCLKWSSPISTYFRIRLVVRDSANQDSVFSSSVINGQSFRMLAGNTDPGLGGSGEKFSLRPYIADGSSTDVAQGSLVVTKFGDVFLQDADKGIVKIDAVSGVAEVFLSESGVYSGDNVHVSSATARDIYQMRMDYSNNLWVFDYDRIRKIDLSTGTITTVIGGGTSSNANLENPLDLKIHQMSWVGYMNPLTFLILPNGHIYFDSEKFYIGTRSANSIRVYKPEEQNKIQTITFDGTESSVGAQTTGMAECNFYRLAMEFEPETSQINYFISGLFNYGTYWANNLCRGDSHASSTQAGYYVATFDPETYQSRNGGNHFSTAAGYYNHQQRHITGQDGRLYIVRKDQGRVYLADDQTGSTTHIMGGGFGRDCVDGTPILSCKMNIQDIFVSETGRLYVLDDGRVRTEDNAGNIVTLYGENRTFGDGGHPLYARFGTINETFVGNDGRILISDYYNFRLREVGVTGQSVSHLAGNGAYNTAPNVDALTTGLYGGWSTLGIFMDPVSNDIYNRADSGGEYIGRLNRVTNQWEKVIGSQSLLHPWTPGSDGQEGLDIDLTYLPMNRPVGFANGKLLVLSGHYGTEPDDLVNRYRYTGIKQYDTNDSFRQSHLVGSQTQIFSGHYGMCADGTSVNDCLAFIGSAGYSMMVHHDPTDDKYITTEKRGSSRVVSIHPGQTVETLATLPRGAAAMAYRRNGSQEFLYYCATSGQKVYKYEVGVGETVLPWPSDSIKCTGYTIQYDSVKDRLVFPIEQNGLFGVAEITNP